MLPVPPVRWSSCRPSPAVAEPLPRPPRSCRRDHLFHQRLVPLPSFRVFAATETRSPPFRLDGFHPWAFRPGPEDLSPAPVFGVLGASIGESSIRSVRLLRSFAPPALPGFFATTTSADFSRALTLEISPSKVLHLSPRAARLYLMRLDGVRVSLLLASSPPAPGLAAGSCSCGRGFAFRFLQLHLAATPCGSARVGPITSLGIFHPLDTAHVGRTSGDFLVADPGAWFTEDD